MTETDWQKTFDFISSIKTSICVKLTDNFKILHFNKLCDYYNPSTSTANPLPIVLKYSVKKYINCIDAYVTELTMTNYTWVDVINGGGRNQLFGGKSQETAQKLYDFIKMLGNPEEETADLIGYDGIELSSVKEVGSDLIRFE